jgi:hypothetical protein
VKETEITVAAIKAKEVAAVVKTETMVVATVAVAKNGKQAK